ncbi:MAG: hypothetical protein N2595_05515 [bacterium]|nr:hypothetical protein [bacterium]
MIVLPKNPSSDAHTISRLFDHILNGLPLPPDMIATQERPGDHVRAAVYAAARAALPTSPPKTHPLAWFRTARPYLAWAASATALVVLCALLSLHHVPNTSLDTLMDAVTAQWEDPTFADECGIDIDDIQRMAIADSLAWIESDLASESLALTYHN